MTKGTGVQTLEEDAIPACRGREGRPGLLQWATENGTTTFDLKTVPRKLSTQHLGQTQRIFKSQVLRSKATEDCVTQTEGLIRKEATKNPRPGVSLVELLLRRRGGGRRRGLAWTCELWLTWEAMHPFSAGMAGWQQREPAFSLRE